MPILLDRNTLTAENVLLGWKCSQTWTFLCFKNGQWLNSWNVKLTRSLDKRQWRWRHLWRSFTLVWLSCICPSRVEATVRVHWTDPLWRTQAPFPGDWSWHILLTWLRVPEHSSIAAERPLRPVRLCSNSPQRRLLWWSGCGSHSRRGCHDKIQTRPVYCFWIFGYSWSILCWNYIVMFCMVSLSPRAFFFV